MPYNLESEGTETPTLTEMTQAAIKMLEKEAYGYVLLVEGNLMLTFIQESRCSHHCTRNKTSINEGLYEIVF